MTSDRPDAIQRRTLLHAAAALLLGTVTSRPAMSAPSASALAALLPDTREAARLGRLVLADRPAAGAAGQALLSRLDAAAHDRTAISDQLDRIVKDQFQTLDTCIVDGWVLARAEAELCAAVALHDKGLT